MHTFFKLQRANEELQRVYVELRRLQVYIFVSEAHQRRILNELESSPDRVEKLYGFQLRRRRRLRVAQCLRHIRLLDKLEQRPGFSGFKDAARHIPGYAEIRNALVSEVADVDRVEGGLERAVDDAIEQEKDELEEALGDALEALASMPDDSTVYNS